MSESTLPTNHRQLGHRSEFVAYASEPFVIGRHEWQIVVVPNRLHPHHSVTDAEQPKFVTDYYWRHIGTDFWKNKDQWPSYNHNDGTHAGCPKSLVTLYNQEQKALAEFIPRINARYQASDEGRQMALI